MFLLTGCSATPEGDIGRPVVRRGDEIMAAGQLIHAGTPVVLFCDPGGYDAYRVERRFVPYDRAGWSATTRDTHAIDAPNRYGVRDAGLSDAELQQVRGGGWTVPLLRKKIDEIVIHYDADGTSRGCFQTLQDGRGLSTHFMIDLDGTVYQTLDVKEKAWHATTANGRSIGIELANIGCATTPALLAQWYHADADGRTTITLPQKLGDGGERTPKFVGHPIRDGPIRGVIQRQTLVQYDYTPQQYAALIHLVAALCRTFPEIACDFPHDAAGHVIPHKLPDAELAAYHGVLGHYHVQTNKIDPGPAFQWDRVIDGVRRLLR